MILSKNSELLKEEKNILNSYPKERPSLPDSHKEIYVKEYKSNREGKLFFEHLSKLAESWMHRRVSHCSNSAVLEVGAGTLSHLKYENNISSYDIVEPFHELYRGKKELELIKNVYMKIEEIPKHNSYSRIISIAVLEHLENLPFDIANLCRHLSKDGIFQAGIPSEGSFLWWLGWRGTTGLSYWLRNKLDYKFVMQHEHLNNANEIITIIRMIFEDIVVERFPLPIHNLSLYSYIEAKNPRMKVVDSILREYQ